MSDEEDEAEEASEGGEEREGDGIYRPPKLAPMPYVEPQKKKEREVALESKAKELEARVTELERECEGLRRENGWLKGLVVGVTGVAAPPVMTPALSSGAKRSREDDA